MRIVAKESFDLVRTRKIEYGTRVFFEFYIIWTMIKGWHGWIYDNLIRI